MSRFLQFIRGFTQSPTLRSLIAIDPGSHRTKVLIEGRVVWSQPSLMVLNQATGDPIAIGNRAIEMRGKLPPSMKLWEPSVRGELRLSAETQAYFYYILQQVLTERQRLWFPFVDCIVPVGMTPSYQRGLATLLTAAKGEVRETVSQPAAVWRWLRHQQVVGSQGCVLVLGHGVSDIGYFQRDLAVLQSRILLAGQDFSESIRESVRSQLQLEISSQVIEELKRSVARVAVGGEPAQEDEYRQVIKGKHVISKIPGSAVVTNEVLSEGLEEVAERLVGEVRLFLQSLPSESMGSLLDQGILITGGTSQLAGLAMYLEEKLQIRILPSETPDLDVIQGLGF